MATHYHFVYRVVNRQGYQVTVRSMLTFTHRMEAARRGAKVFEVEKISTVVCHESDCAAPGSPPGPQGF